MGTIIDKLNYLTETKSQIKQALIDKGQEVLDIDTFRSYVDKINDIGKWKPQPDWWDIDKILEDDTEDYAGKMIILLNNTSETSQFAYTGANKIVTSDGFTYEDLSSSITHTWDSTKDKNGTRYIILYYSSNIVIRGWYASYINGTMYIIFKGDGTNYAMHTNPDRWWDNSGFYGLKKIKFINITASFFDNFTCNSLNTIENLKWYNRNSFHFIYSFALKNVSMENITQDFKMTYSSELTHESLINILNALKDYSETSTMHTLTIGWLNIQSLTDDEIAIATNKNWTLAW